jgi:hypothetical protein
MSYDLQGAINADTVGRVTIPSTGGVVSIGNVTISKPMIIEGSGPWATVMQGTISIGDATGVVLRDFQLQAPTAGSGTGITIGTSAVSYHPVFQNLLIANFAVGINDQASCLAEFDNVYFSGYTQYGLELANTFNGDQGDNKVTNCCFSTSANASAGIFQTSSGGLSIIGTKFLGGQWAYDSMFSCATSDLFFNGGTSVENQTVGGVRVQTIPGTVFNNFAMTGCQFAGGFNGMVMSGVNNMAITATIFNVPGFTAMNLTNCNVIHIYNDPIPAGVTPLVMTNCNP